MTPSQRAAARLKVALDALDKAGGSLPLQGIYSAVEHGVETTEREREIGTKTGRPRWWTKFLFSSTGLARADAIVKRNGLWSITPEGRSLLKLSADELARVVTRKYTAWLRSRNPELQATTSQDDEEAELAADISSTTLEDAKARASQQILDRIRSMGPYDFQELVGALLRGMGYTTRYIAKPGPDGGTDLLAYRDPLGADKPHIRTQVKHREAKATRQEIASLRGILRSDREIGLFVSTGGFASQAVREAGNGNSHIELLDIDEFLNHWLKHYERMSEEDKNLLRLERLYFLAPG